MNEEEVHLRRESLRSLLLELWDMQTETAALEKRLESWKQKALAAYQKLDDQLNGENS